MIKYLLILGSNLGNRESLLNEATNAIEVLTGAEVVKSGFYESEPWGFDSKDWFLNQAVICNSSQVPELFLKSLLKIERELGRARTISTGYSSRTIDIDILLADDLLVHSDSLCVPHPKMNQRKFVLIPAAEIASDWIHPLEKQTLGSLLRVCSDNCEVRAL